MIDILNTGRFGAAQGDRDILRPCLPALRREVARARQLAGETGPDPHLDGRLGGSTAPAAVHGPARDRKIAGVGSAAREGLGFGLGIIPGLFLGAAAVAGGVALWQHQTRRAHRT